MLGSFFHWVFSPPQPSAAYMARNPTPPGIPPPSILQKITRIIQSGFRQEFYTINFKEPDKHGTIGYGIKSISPAKEAEIINAKGTDMIEIDPRKGHAEAVSILKKGCQPTRRNKIIIPMGNVLSIDDGPAPR